MFRLAELNANYITFLLPTMSLIHQIVYSNCFSDRLSLYLSAWTMNGYFVWAPCLKCTNTLPKFLLSLLIRWYFFFMSGRSRKRRTVFFNCPLPFPGMISTRAILFSLASAIIRLSSFSIKFPFLHISCKSSFSFAIRSLSPHPSNSTSGKKVLRMQRKK